MSMDDVGEAMDNTLVLVPAKINRKRAATIKLPIRIFRSSWRDDACIIRPKENITPAKISNKG